MTADRWASRAWTEPQKRWLKRIGEQIEKEIVVDREALDTEPFRATEAFEPAQQSVRRRA